MGDLIPTVALGGTGEQVSALCLGTDYYGSRTSRDRAFDLLDEFAAVGGTFVDTANVYGSSEPGFHGGESESTIGDWMAQRGTRDQMFVATKVAGPYQDVPRGLRAVDIRRECDKSLARLRCDVIDLYLAHVDDPETPLEEILEAFDDLVLAGKIRFVGLSNWQLGRLDAARSLADLRGWSTLGAVQLRHTYLRPAPGADFGDQVTLDDEVQTFAETYHIAVLAYSILLNGAYTRPQRALDERYVGADATNRLDVLHAIAGETGASPNQVIIAWMLRTTPTIIPIVGGSTVEQIRENTRSVAVTLTREQLRRLNDAGSFEVDPDPPRAAS